MSVVRTPPKSGSKKTSPVHYGSDSALHTSESHEHPEFNITRRFKRRLEDTSDCSNISLVQLQNMFEDLQSKQEAKFDALISTMDAVLKQNDEIKTSMNLLSDKYDEILLNMKKVQQENNNNKNRIKILEAQLEHLEKKSRSGTVELRNIPKMESETKQSLIELTKNIGAVLDTTIQNSDIRDVYRMKIKDKPNAPIIVDFNSTLTKESIIKSTITYNKGKPTGEKFNTGNLKLPGPSKPIYIAESLTKKTKRLHYLVRLFAKENHFDSCWTSYGKVYLRRKSGDPRVCIDCEEDLVNLKNCI